MVLGRLLGGRVVMIRRLVGLVGCFRLGVGCWPEGGAAIMKEVVVATDLSVMDRSAMVMSVVSRVMCLALV